jgi:hypothetical protein
VRSRHPAPRGRACGRTPAPPDRPRRIPGAGRTLDDLTTGLDRLEEKASHPRLPLSYADLLYTLRVHIALVRERFAYYVNPSSAPDSR